MLAMVSYSHRSQSGPIMCYLDRNYHVLPTPTSPSLDTPHRRVYPSQRPGN